MKKVEMRTLAKLRVRHPVKPKMKPDQLLQVRLITNAGEPFPLGNVMIELNFFTKGNFRYSFVVGRTQKDGTLTVSYPEVEAVRRAYGELNVMDYNTKLDDCDPQIEVEIDSEENLRKRYQVVLRDYRKPPDFAKDWPSNVQVRAQKVKVELVEQITVVNIATA